MKITILTFSLQSDFTLRKLADGMIGRKFEEGSDAGFDIDQIKKQEISGNFLYRRIKRTKVSKTDGSVEIITNESIDKFPFKILNNENLLLLFNAGLAGKAFIANLATISRFSAFVEPAFESLENFCESLAHKINSIQLHRIYINNVKLSKGISGVIAAQGIFSNSAFNGVIGNLQGNVVRVDFTWETNSHVEFLISVTTNGRLSIKNCSSVESAKSVILDIIGPGID